MLEQSYFTPPVEYTAKEANELEVLTGFENSVLAVVEQTWWNTKKLLTPLTAAAKLNLDKDLLKVVWKKPAFQHALRTKGLVNDSQFADFLTPKQIEAVNRVLTRQDTKSLREKLKSCGVTVNQWNGWLSNPTFYKYLQDRFGSDFKAGNITAQSQLLNAVEEGDMVAIKMLLEIQGIYQNKVQVEVNFSAFMEQIATIIAHFVPDDQLEAAATALEKVFSLHDPRSGAVDVLSELAISPGVSV